MATDKNVIEWMYVCTGMLKNMKNKQKLKKSGILPPNI